MNALKTLTNRGFVSQITNADQLNILFNKQNEIIFYIGFDPTADSLTAGHLVPLIAMSHLQRMGHKAIFLLGGGTGFIGDPTDRSDMRRLMRPEEILHNVECFKNQLSNLLDIDNLIVVDNSDWLLKLEYVKFIRMYGIHFSVNKMLTADAYRTRFERGLSFFEFNYMLMQAYDFLELNRRYNCILQIGGSDQWSNILAGVNLINRVDNKTVFGMTLKLLTKSNGEKMGKSVSGAIWLDKNKTSTYDFFQYWRNVDDKDVMNCLKLLTFLDVEEIIDLVNTNINHAKEVLAFELTKTIHGIKEAEKNLSVAKSLFDKKDLSYDMIPSYNLSSAELNNKISLIDLFDKIALTTSRSETRRLIEQGGVRLNSKRILDVSYIITNKDFIDNRLTIQSGKKKFINVKLINI